MKKTLITALLMGVAAGAFAQGTVAFINNGSGVKAPVYGPELGDIYASKTGNTAAGTPTGTQTYTGALLAGSNFRAQLFGANLANQTEGSLTAGLPVNTFRTGTAAGFLATVTATINAPADAANATVQVRAWDNTSGLYPDWASAEVAWLGGLIAAGKSPLLNVASLGGGIGTAPLMTGLQSFNIYMIPVPEPSTFVLAGLGAAGLLIFRRRK